MTLNTIFSVAVDSPVFCANMMGHKYLSSSVSLENWKAGRLHPCMLSLQAVSKYYRTCILPSLKGDRFSMPHSNLSTHKYVIRMSRELQPMCHIAIILRVLRAPSKKQFAALLSKSSGHRLNFDKIKQTFGKKEIPSVYLHMSIHGLG